MSDFFGSIVGHGNKKDEDRNENDFYPTPPIATFSLTKSIDVPNKIWEPASGKGHISSEFKRLGHDVYSSDLNVYEDAIIDDIKSRDFLYGDDVPSVDAIITNPPYKNKLAQKFVLRALDFDIPFVAMFCRMQFINGKERYNTIYSKQPPSHIFAFTARINCNEDNANSYYGKQQVGGMLEYFWYVWDRRTTYTNTIINWINVEDMIIQYDASKNKNTIENFI